MRGDAGRTQARCDCRVLFAAKLGACRQWCVVVDRTRVGGVGSRCVTDDGSRGCRQADRVGVLVKDSSASHSSGDGAWRVGSVPSWFDRFRDRERERRIDRRGGTTTARAGSRPTSSRRNGLDGKTTDSGDRSDRGDGGPGRYARTPTPCSHRSLRRGQRCRGRDGKDLGKRSGRAGSGIRRPTTRVGSVGMPKRLSNVRAATSRRALRVDQRITILAVQLWPS